MYPINGVVKSPFTLLYSAVEYPCTLYYSVVESFFITRYYFQCYGFSIYAVLRTLVLGNLPVPYRMVSYNILVPFTSVVDYPCTLYKSVVQSACTQYWSCVALEDTTRYAGLLLSPGLRPRAFFLSFFLQKK